MSYEQNHHQSLYTLIIIQNENDKKTEILMIEGAPFPAIEKV